jgi:hypothetical protein
MVPVVSNESHDAYMCTLNCVLDNTSHLCGERNTVKTLAAPNKAE